jgi:hypothetical protein
MRYTSGNRSLESRRRSDLTSSWGTHVCTPCSSTPAGSIVPGLLGTLTRPPLVATTWAPTTDLRFRSSIAWLYTLAVYASYTFSQTHTQDSLPAVGQTLPGGTDYPLSSNERFLEMCPTSRSSFPKLNSTQCHGQKVRRSDLTIRGIVPSNFQPVRIAETISISVG